MKIFLIVCASFLFGIVWFVMSLVGCALMARYEIARHNNQRYPITSFDKQHYVDDALSMWFGFFLLWWLCIPIYILCLWWMQEHSLLRDVRELSRTFTTKFVPEEPR